MFRAVRYKTVSIEAKIYNLEQAAEESLFCPAELSYVMGKAKNENQV